MIACNQSFFSVVVVVVVVESGVGAAGTAVGAGAGAIVVVVVSFFVSVVFWSHAVTVSGIANRAATVSAVAKLIFMIASSVSAEMPAFTDQLRSAVGRSLKTRIRAGQHRPIRTKGGIVRDPHVAICCAVVI